MNYKNLRHFYDIASAGNMTRAAELNHISQSTLSIHLKELETELNCKLLARKNKDMILTPQGQILYDWAHAFFSQEFIITEKMRTSMASTASKLSIGAMGSAFMHKLPAIVDAFRNKYPDIHVTIERYPWDPLMRAMKNKSVDVAFSIVNKKNSKDYHSYILEDGKTCLAISKNHPLATKEYVTPKDLEQEPFVILNRHLESTAYRNTMLFFENAGIKPAIVDEVSYIEPLFSFVNIGKGVTITSNLSSLIHYNNIKIVPLQPDMEMWLAMQWHKRPNNPATQLFTDFVMENFSNKKEDPK